MVSARSMRRWFGALVAVVALCVCAPLYAQGSEEALDTVREANGHYDAGEFSRALLKYRQAYDVLEDVRLLYRIGLSYENLGNYARARQTLLRYLELDKDSPVEGRVRAKIDQLRDLEENIQAYLVIDSVPAGATVYLNEYMGESEGQAPVTMPVGAGENVVTLVFPDRQRLQAVVEVGAGATVERIFQVGSAAPPRQSEELASTETTEVEVGQPEAPLVEGPAEDGSLAEESGPDAAEPEVAEATGEEDVIPMPGSERAMDRPVRLDRISVAPPWWANALAVTGFVGSALCGAGAFSGALSVGQAVGCGVVLTGAGFFLLGRDWSGHLPPASAAPGFAGADEGAATRALGVSFSGRF
ncbi:PEGA domain-containing protein [Bradymonadaceae bacterium TMQ3]|nr:PEGA domain-containing protein [Bradymonadaceae bacterium TMQ3]TXC76418.1 PEGA domain-containing protein [Bradymonadales bacterium TMQ1]